MFIRRLAVTTTAMAAAAVMFAPSALAFDCIRVSAGVRGIEHSTKSGNWITISVPEFTSGLNQQGYDGDCVLAAYSSTGKPLIFDLGVGVAGGRTGHGNGVLAIHAPDKVLSDGRGIDHLEDSVLPALGDALTACNVPLSVLDEG